MLKENEDFHYNEDGFMVFTSTYHLKRGYCCKNECKHCPWNFRKKQTSEEKTIKTKPK